MWRARATSVWPYRALFGVVAEGDLDIRHIELREKGFGALAVRARGQGEHRDAPHGRRRGGGGGGDGWGVGGGGACRLRVENEGGAARGVPSCS